MIIEQVHTTSARIRYAVLACYVVGLLALTLAPLPETAYRLASRQGFDKAVHFVLFGGLAFLWYWNQLVAGRPTMWRVMGPSATLAALVELFQGLLGYRTADVWDFLWGGVGALAAHGLAGWLLRRAAALHSGPA